MPLADEEAPGDSCRVYHRWVEVVEFEFEPKKGNNSVQRHDSDEGDLYASACSEGGWGEGQGD